MQMYSNCRGRLLGDSFNPGRHGASVSMWQRAPPPAFCGGPPQFLQQPTPPLVPSLEHFPRFHQRAFTPSLPHIQEQQQQQPPCLKFPFTDEKSSSAEKTVVEYRSHMLNGCEGRGQGGLPGGMWNPWVPPPPSNLCSGVIASRGLPPLYGLRAPFFSCTPDYSRPPPSTKPDYSRPPPPLYHLPMALLNTAADQGTIPKQPTTLPLSEVTPSFTGEDKVKSDQSAGCAGKVTIGALKPEDWKFLNSLERCKDKRKPESRPVTVKPVDPRLKNRASNADIPPPRVKKTELIDGSLENSHSPPFWNRYLNPPVACYLNHTAFPLDINEKDPRFALFNRRNKMPFSGVATVDYASKRKLGGEITLTSKLFEVSKKTCLYN